VSVSVRDWRVTLKPWADRRLWFVQARCGGRVVWGVVYDADDPDSVSLARRAIATLRAAGADCSALPAVLPGSPGAPGA
jgi:hypothetical protein